MAFVDPIDVITGELWTAVAHNLYLNANLRDLNDRLLDVNASWSPVAVTGAGSVSAATINTNIILVCSGSPAYSIVLPSANDAALDVPSHGVRFVRTGIADITISVASGTIAGDTTFVLAIAHQSVELVPYAASNNWMAF